MNHEQIKKEIENQITDAVNILDRLAGLSQNTTSPAHRELVEKIIGAALLEAVLIQAQAMSAVRGGE